MKKIVLIVFAGLMVSFAASAQSKAQKEVLAKVQDLNWAVFGSKDSTAIADLLSDDVTYGHSGGNIESKAAMIRNATANKTTYKEQIMGDPLFTEKSGTVIIRFTFSATQTAPDGKVSPLKLGVIQVWMKEKKKWKLLARQAVKLEVK